MIVQQVFVAAAVLAFALPALGATGARPDPAPTESMRRMPFTHLGTRPVIELRGPAGAATFDFGTRSDELVTRATLRVKYAYSPAFDPASHLRVRVNDEVVGVLAFAADGAGRTLTRELDVNPKLVAGANRVSLDVVARRGTAPEDPRRPGLWAEVSGSSELELATQPLTVPDDLSRLPEPFFDRRDQRKLSLPVLLAAQPSRPALRAAGIVASWFGRHAAWRGARFPVRLDEAPAGHAIAFATNDERPSLLRELPPAAGPELRVMANPADPRFKLLVVRGRDGEELRRAAIALVLGKPALSGAVARVGEVAEPAPREADDAPAWVRLDRAMTFAELIEWPQQLETAGLAPALDPIRVDFRMPPDVAAARSPGVPIRLRFRYTPPPCAADARLEVGVSDEAITTLNLRVTAREIEAGAARPAMPEPIEEEAEIAIPAFRLRTRGQLQFAFRFETRAAGECRDSRPRLARASVDADSRIDFTGFPRHVEMPQLGHFATIGFPFTRHADLSRTVVVLPDPPGRADIETMLAFASRAGEATGAPATALRIAGPADESALAGADLLVIGASPGQPLLDRWSAKLPATLAGQVRGVGSPAREQGVIAGIGGWLGISTTKDRAVSGRVSVSADGPLAALLAFESPLTAGRSVVVATARAPEQLATLLDAMDDGDARRAMRGSAVFVHGGGLESVTVGSTYEIGFFPPWTGLGRRLAGEPVLVAAVGLLLLFLAGYGAWRWRVITRRKLAGRTA
jgi:hypothetical protein